MQCSALWGLVNCRERWSLSLRGWLLLVLALMGASLAFFLQVYPFLAVTDRVPTNILVVEGWIPQYAMRAAVAEFKSGAYQRVYTTGGPVDGSGQDASESQTAAYLGAARLKSAWLPEDVIQAVPSFPRGRDRTYSSAVALRDWLRNHDALAPSLNVVTVAAHARRTQLLYRKAFGDSVKIGVIAVPNEEFVMFSARRLPTSMRGFSFRRRIRNRANSRSPGGYPNVSGRPSCSF